MRKFFQNFIYFAIFFLSNLFSNYFASKSSKILRFIYYHMLMNECGIAENEFQKMFYEHLY